MLSIEQKRTVYAYDGIMKIARETNVDSYSEMRSYIKKIPMMIKVNGLTKTVVYCLSKEKYDEIITIVMDWLKDIKYINVPSNLEPLKCIMDLNSTSYMLATNEAINLLVWLGRFADVQLKEDGKGDKNG